MSSAVRIGVAAAAALCVLPVGLVVLVSAVVGVPGASASAFACAPAPNAAPARAGDGLPGQGDWSGEQVTNAATIVQVGVQAKVATQGWTVAVATAIQESSLRNLGDLGAANDHDSLGLFQQRPSQGWGTAEQILDPRYAARAFYDKLLTVDGWESLPLTQAAQAVQRSRFPGAYAKWQSSAQQLVEHVRTRLAISCTAGGTGAWKTPLPAGAYEVGSPFGPRAGRIHRGVDLIAGEGTPIFAAAAGQVTYAGCNSPRCDIPGSPTMPGCGLMVEIQHAGEFGTTYCHAVRLLVTQGQSVTAGQHIADVGTTGHSSGNHLHFQVHKPAPPIANSTAVDPLPFMASVGAAL